MYFCHFILKENWPLGTWPISNVQSWHSCVTCSCAVGPNSSSWYLGLHPVYYSTDQIRHPSQQQGVIYPDKRIRTQRSSLNKPTTAYAAHFILWSGGITHRSTLPFGKSLPSRLLFAFYSNTVFGVFPFFLFLSSFYLEYLSPYMVCAWHYCNVELFRPWCYLMIGSWSCNITRHYCTTLLQAEIFVKAWWTLHVDNERIKYSHSINRHHKCCSL